MLERQILLQIDTRRHIYILITFWPLNNCNFSSSISYLSRPGKLLLHIDLKAMDIPHDRLSNKTSKMSRDKMWPRLRRSDSLRGFLSPSSCPGGSTGRFTSLFGIEMDAELKQKIIHDHGHLISSSKLSGSCDAQNSGSKEDTGPPTPAPGLVINFGYVAPGIYRSSFPQADNFEHLASLGLFSILWGHTDPRNQSIAQLKYSRTLVAGPYPAKIVEFIEGNGIQRFQIVIPAHKDETVVIPAQRIAAALRILSDSRNHPILVHCNKGKVKPSLAWILICCF